MQNRLREKLRRVTAILLDGSRPAYSLRNEVLELKSIFEEVSGPIGDESEDIASGEIRTPGGVAISPRMAAMCVDDYARTVQFLRATYDAIMDLRRQPLRPVHVLYAGCGPWAPLAVPLMSIIAPEDVQFSLLDIHEESIGSIRRLTSELGFRDHVRNFETADAANYSVGTDRRPDLIVIEMLRQAMDAEPQVAVARNLTRQAPAAVLIPSEIRIDLMLVDPSREQSAGESPPERNRIFLATVFQFNRNTIGSLEAAPVRVTLPPFDENQYRPMLMTTVNIYGGLSLSDYDSGITLPKRVPTAIGAGDTVEFAYEVSESPRLSVRLIR